jgi:hypothetical protein
MAESSGPWDDSGGDRTYTAAQVAAFWGNMAIQDGVVFGKLNSLAPSNDGTLTITLATGYCYKTGVYYYNSAAYSLSLNSCTTGYKRIDYLVIRYDPTTTRSAFAYVIPGVATTGTPSAPAIGSTDIPIGTILVDNSTGTYAYTVTDVRQSLTVSGLSPILVNGKIVGERFFTGIKLTPGTSCPVIPRFDANHDVTSTGGGAGTNAPLLVALYRAEVASIPTGGSFYTSWSVTVSGSTVTFGGSGDGILSAIQNDALVSGFLSGNQAATFAADYTTAASQICVNIAGVDYIVSGVSTGSRTLTVSGSPATGSQTLILYPYRIAGSTTSIRLRKLSGFVQVVTGDYDGEVVAGLRIMDREQEHIHSTSVHTYAYTSSGTATVAGNTANGSQADISQNNTGVSITDGTHGTPRTGKTTSPRSAGGYLYEWAGLLN